MTDSTRRRLPCVAAVLCSLAACSTIDWRASSTDVNSIPLRLRSPDAPVLMATIGKDQVPLWLDLGDGTPLTLQQSVLDAAKAIPTGESIQLQGIDGTFEAPIFKVPRIQIGSTVFTNVTAKLDVPRAGYMPSDSKRGVLGSALLKGGAVVLDYKNRRLIMLLGESARKRALCQGTVVPFSNASPVWKGEAVTEAETDFGHVTLWWDTGAQATMLSKSVSHSTDRIYSKHFVLGGRDFGPYSFGLIEASLPGFDGMVGDDFFMRHQVCIDYAGSRLVIGP